MPTLNITTTKAKEIWKSPDGNRVIYELLLDYEGKPVQAKTFSREIAEEGWEGTVETYEKQGRGGIETFVKQPQKEQFRGGGYAGESKPKYQPKDEKAIQAMWAIGQSNGAHEPLKASDKIEVRTVSVEAYAQELFNMVDRVKATPPDLVDKVHEVPDFPADTKQLEAFLED